MPLREKRPALLLIDLQKAFLDEDFWGGDRNNRDAEQICGQLLAHWRALALPVFHIRHSSTDPKSKLHALNNPEGFEFSEYIKPLAGEPVITKRVNSAFIGTDLQEQLDQAQLKTLVIVGLTTNHCISTTTRMAGNLGYETYVISDATATFARQGVRNETYAAQTIHWTTLASLNEEFATVWDTQTLLECL